MRKFSISLAALALVSAASCRRQPFEADDKDGGTDVGPPSISDAARNDAPVAPAPDALDGPADASDASDASDAFDTAPAVCPAGVLPVADCGCG